MQKQVKAWMCNGGIEAHLGGGLEARRWMLKGL